MRTTWIGQVIKAGCLTLVVILVAVVGFLTIRATVSWAGERIAEARGSARVAQFSPLKPQVIFVTPNPTYSAIAALSDGKGVAAPLVQTTGGNSFSGLSVSPDTDNCKEQMWGPWPKVSGGYNDLPIEIGGPEVNTTFVLGHVWWEGAEAASILKEERGALWRVSPDNVQLGSGPNQPNKVGVVFVLPGHLVPEVHFGAGVQGGVAWLLCRSVSMKVNSWTVQQAFEEISEAADKYAGELDAKNRSGTDAQIVYRANFPYAIKAMVGLLNCVTPGENGVAQCSGTYQPKPGEVPGPVVPTAVMSGVKGAAVSLAAPVIQMVQTAMPRVVIVAPTATPVPVARAKVVKVTKCDPVSQVAGAESFTASAPEVLDFFAGATGQGVTFVFPGQTVNIVPGNMNYKRFVLAPGCDAEALAAKDAFEPAGRKFYKQAELTQVLPSVTFSGEVASVAPVKSNVAGLKVEAPAVAVQRVLHPEMGAWGMQINQPPSGKSPRWVVDVAWFSVEQEKDDRADQAKNVGVPILRGVNGVYVEVFGMDGKRLPNIPVRMWWGGEKGLVRNSSDKGPDDPFATDFPIYSKGLYNIVIDDGQPSEWVSGVGMGNHQEIGGKTVRVNTHIGCFLRFRQVAP